MSSLKWSQLKPLDWAKYVNKHVRVTATAQQRHQGWVYTVDPVSTSVVLVNFLEKDKGTVTVVMGHAVEEVEVLQEASQETAERLRAVFTPQGARALGADELKLRKESLRLWLQKNRVPVEVEGEGLRVAGVLTVNPPYGAQDCSSPNQIILARVQSLVESNPGAEQDQDPGAEPEQDQSRNLDQTRILDQNRTMDQDPVSEQPVSA